MAAARQQGRGIILYTDLGRYVILVSVSVMKRFAAGSPSGRNGWATWPPQHGIPVDCLRYSRTMDLFHGLHRTGATVPSHAIELHAIYGFVGAMFGPEYSREYVTAPDKIDVECASGIRLGDTSRAGTHKDAGRTRRVQTARWIARRGHRRRTDIPPSAGPITVRSGGGIDRKHARVPLARAG